MPAREALAERIERLEAAWGRGGRPGRRRPPDPARRHGARRRGERGSPDVRRRAPTRPRPWPEPRARRREGTASRRSRRPSPLADGVDLEKVVGLWPGVVEQVRRVGVGVARAGPRRREAGGRRPEEGVVEVGFPASAAFNKRKAEEQEARERVADAVRTIVGEPLRPVYVLLDDDADRRWRGR